MRKYLFGTVLALLLSLPCVCSMAVAQEDTSGTVLLDDIQPYTGPIGADSPLYSLKIALEDIDESFTANETERVDKQMNHARLRLSEVRRSLDLNQNDSAEEALNNYWLKMDLTNMTIARWRSNTTALLHAQEMIVKHQFVLERLLASHPNNTGLMRAYNNSLRLQERFEEKTAVRYQRSIEKNNQTIMKAIRIEQKVNDRTGWPDANATATPDDRKGPDKDRNKGGSADDNLVTTVTIPVSSGIPHTQPDNRGQNHQQGGNNDKGKDNSKG